MQQKPMRSNSRRSAMLALLLIAPAPTVGTLLWLYVTHPTLKIVGLLLGKIWLFGGPLAWRKWVDREPWSLSPPQKGGFALSVITGLAISGIIWLAYLLLADALIDPVVVRERAVSQGLDNLWAYLAISVYIVVINSVLEEYVFRWFFFRKCEVVGGGAFGVIGSGLIFCVHHVFPIYAYFGNWTIVALCSLGIFIGGALWSWMYLRYRSVWVPYVSHALVDVGMLTVGAAIIFG